MQQARKENPEQWRQTELPILAALAAAPEPLDFPRLCELAEVPTNDRWRDLLDGRWRPFLHVQEDLSNLDEEPSWSVYHTSFRDFLSGRLGGDALVAMSAERPLIRELRRATITRHGRIADRYLNCWGGLDAGLPSLADHSAVELDGGYGLHHLAYHLVQAGRELDLHTLLACGRPGTSAEDMTPQQQVNVWFDAHRRVGDISGYLRDVEVGHRLAERSSEQAVKSGQTPTSFPLELRYLLIATSITSMARRIPPTLLESLVAHEVWRREEALAHARRIDHPGQRAEAFIILAEQHGGTERAGMLEEALAAVGAVPHTYRRWLSKLLPPIAAVLPAEALKTAAAESEPVRASILAALGPQLRGVDLSHAVDLAELIDDELARVDTLAALLPWLPPTEAVTRAQEAEKKARAAPGRLLAAILGQVPQRQHAEVARASLTASAETPAPLERIRTTVMLAQRSAPEQRAWLLRRALDDLGALEDSDRDQALRLLAPCLPAKARALSVDLSAEQRQHILALTAAGLPAAEATALAENLLKENADLLTGDAGPLIAPYLTESSMRDALERARTRGGYVQTLKVLASFLPCDAIPLALNGISDLVGQEARARSLAALAPRLGAAQCRQALAIATRVDDDGHQCLAAASLGRWLNHPTCAHVVESARRIFLTTLRGDQPPLLPLLKQPHLTSTYPAPENLLLLAAAALGLPEPSRSNLFADTVTLALQESNEAASGVLGVLFPHLPQHLRQKCLEALDHAADTALWWGFIGSLPGMPGCADHEPITGPLGVNLWAQYQARHRRLDNAPLAVGDYISALVPEFGRIFLLFCAPYLPQHYSAIIEEARRLAVEHPRWCANALRRAALRLPQELVPEAISIATGLANDPFQRYRDIALAALVPRLPYVDAAEKVRTIRTCYF